MAVLNRNELESGGWGRGLNPNSRSIYGDFESSAFSTNTPAILMQVVLCSNSRNTALNNLYVRVF